MASQWATRSIISSFEKAFSSQKIDDINRFVNEYSNMTDEHRKKINARLSYLRKQQHNKQIIDSQNCKLNI